VTVKAEFDRSHARGGALVTKAPTAEELPSLEFRKKVLAGPAQVRLTWFDEPLLELRHARPDCLSHSKEPLVRRGIPQKVGARLLALHDDGLRAGFPIVAELWSSDAKRSRA